MEWISFINSINGEELARISLDGYFAGEIKSTKELLSYENNIPIDKIEARGV